MFFNFLFKKFSITDRDSRILEVKWSDLHILFQTIHLEHCTSCLVTCIMGWWADSLQCRIILDITVHIFKWGCYLVVHECLVTQVLMRIVLLSWATGSISSGNMLAYDIIGKVCRIICRWSTGFDVVTNGKEVICPWQHQNFKPKTQPFSQALSPLPPLPTDNHSIMQSEKGPLWTDTSPIVHYGEYTPLLWVLGQCCSL